MIVLDTNALRSFALDGPQMAVLRKLASSEQQPLRIPRIVYEEYVAQKQREMEAAQRRFISAYDDLQRLIPWPGSRPTLRHDLEEVAETYHGNGVKAVFSVIDASSEAASEAISREVWRKPPAKTGSDGPGRGARDALVWLTILEFARQNDPKVYLVSSDKAAFGGPAGLHGALAEEARNAGVDVILLASMEDLFSSLASEQRFPSDFTFDDARLTSEIREHLSHSLAIVDVVSQLGLLRPEQSIVTWNWRDRPDVRLVEIPSRQSYRTGSSDFIVARTRWEAIGTLEYGFEYDVQPETGYAVTPYQLDVEATINLTLLSERESAEGEWRTEVLGQGRAELVTTKRSRSA